MNRREKRPSRKRARPVAQGRGWIGVIVLLALCVAAIGMMAFLNRQPVGSRYAYTTAKDIWYLKDSGMEIAAPRAAEE